MALTVNTNVASLTAQRSLGGSQNMLATSLERLSSGLRINSAKDDAAGLAISERFTAQIRGLNQGVRNANDGISLVQTAEGALKEVTNNLQRIRELAVQSSNATNTANDRASIQEEVSQLVAEIDRVASDTKFNGIALLDGSFSSQAFQVGADSGEQISITSIASARTSSIGGTFSNSVVATNEVDGNSIAADTVFINGIALGAASSSATSKVAAVNLISGLTGVTATAQTDISSVATTGSTAGTVTYGVTINDVLVTAALASQGGAAGTAVADSNTLAIVNAINGLTSQHGVVATQVGGNSYSLSAADGRNVVIADASYGGVNGLTAFNATAGTTRGTITFQSGSAEGFRVSTSAAGAHAADATLGVAIGDTAAAGSGGTGTAISSLSVATLTQAQSALDAVDSALSTINSTRATLGAYQNRFQSVVANLQTASENLSASRSRIVDADFAAETAQLTKAQILQQSGIAMLAQANAIPQNVLALLQ
jgi:flagellin